MRNFGYLPWLQAFQKALGVFHVEQRIVRLDAQEKPVARWPARNRGTLKAGWYGMGNPHNASSPKVAEIAANRMVSSKVMTMYDGQLCSGRPPMLMGKLNDRDVILQQNSRSGPPQNAADQHDQRQLVLGADAAPRCSSSMGNGV